MIFHNLKVTQKTSTSTLREKVLDLLPKKLKNYFLNLFWKIDMDIRIYNMIF